MVNFTQKFLNQAVIILSCALVLLCCVFVAMYSNNVGFEKTYSQEVAESEVDTSGVDKFYGLWYCQSNSAEKSVEINKTTVKFYKNGEEQEYEYNVINRKTFDFVYKIGKFGWRLSEAENKDMQLVDADDTVYVCQKT